MHKLFWDRVKVILSQNSMWREVLLSVCSTNIKIDLPRLHASVMKGAVWSFPPHLVYLKSYKLKYNVLKIESFKHTMICICEITYRSSWSHSVCYFCVYSLCNCHFQTKIDPSFRQKSFEMDAVLQSLLVETNSAVPQWIYVFSHLWASQHKPSWLELILTVITRN